ncbi:unnamed protein product [Penicillium nalgiovense]|uniref:Uncharacterized protein n=1 Tax=Penicillium nalgiovense TaxID=60175 RepID=A0A9W4MZQ7_PENNA|nr:unnamed protein product [Penicillium nalgiovense]CAG7972898.1 unnamed protein product [Penicillium nalgiovense]CAG8041005.1 unnamed protein product [Penicillium nalgiovense]CAG8057071.1 unnamed protein product [Penicillium nalgiovense]CAG8059671.1 unnamed protein product [Penicillium nalgiovense]
MVYSTRRNIHQLVASEETVYSQWKDEDVLWSNRAIEHKEFVYPGGYLFCSSKSTHPFLSKSSITPQLQIHHVRSMSSKNQAKETRLHMEQRGFLMKLEATIKALDKHKLDAAQLKGLNINLCRMTLDQNSELKPHFFAPRHDIPQPSDEILNEACSVGDPEQCFTEPYSRAYAIHTD